MLIRLFRNLFLCYFVSACVSHPERVLNYSWTERSLDEHVIESLVAKFDGDRPRKGVSGKVLVAINQLTIALQEGKNQNCEDFNMNDHIFVYDYTDKFVTIEIERRFVPDSSQVKGEYFDSNGDRRYLSPAIPGARFLDGCSLKGYQYDFRTNKLSRIPPRFPLDEDETY